MKSTHEQHEKMQNTLQEMHNLHLGIALMSVQYQIHFLGGRNKNYGDKSDKSIVNLSNSVRVCVCKNDNTYSKKN